MTIGRMDRTPHNYDPLKVGMSVSSTKEFNICGHEFVKVSPTEQ